MKGNYYFNLLKPRNTQHASKRSDVRVSEENIITPESEQLETFQDL